MNDLKEILIDILNVLNYMNNNHDTGTKNYINELYDKVENLEVTKDD